MQPAIDIPICDLSRRVCDADVLLYRDVPVWRGGYWYSKPIQIAGRSRYTHAAFAARSGLGLFALQSTGFGPRAPLLAEQVRRYPGSIDVYRLRDTVGGFHRDGSIREMMHIIRHQYGWLSLAKISMIHLAGIRWLARASENDREESMYPPFCSEAIARSYRIGGGIDLVPNLADAYTEPGDLARSGKLRFVGTIVKD